MPPTQNATARPHLIRLRLLFLVVALLPIAGSHAYALTVSPWLDYGVWSTDIHTRQAGDPNDRHYLFSTDLWDIDDEHYASLSIRSDSDEYVLDIHVPWPLARPAGKSSPLEFFTADGKTFFSGGACTIFESDCAVRLADGSWRFRVYINEWETIEAMKFGAYMVLTVETKDFSDLVKYVIPLNGSTRALEALSTAKQGHSSAPELAPDLARAKALDHWVEDLWEGGEQWNSDVVDTQEHDGGRYKSYTVFLQDSDTQHNAYLTAYSDDDNFFNLSAHVPWDPELPPESVHSLLIYTKDGNASVYRRDRQPVEKTLFPKDDDAYVFRVRGLPLRALQEMANGRRMEMMVTHRGGAGATSYVIPLTGIKSAIKLILFMGPGYSDGQLD